MTALEKTGKITNVWYRFKKGLLGVDWSVKCNKMKLNKKMWRPGFRLKSMVKKSTRIYDLYL